MIIGYNYHPSQQGIHYWHSWNIAEIEEDLFQMAKKGCRVVRFFVFWNQFEPEEGVYDEEKFERLRRFVELAAGMGVLCIPALLTLWMNGHVFDLSWRNRRSLWRDPVLISRQMNFLERIASELGSYGNIYAYDLGDEMVYADIREAESLSSDDVERWLALMVTAISKGDSKAKIMMGNDSTCAFGGHHFGLQQLANHLDYIGIHGFPLWAPFSIESNGSYKSTLYIPFLVKLTASFGIPIVDEFGLYGASERARSEYVTASGVSCLLSGAAGIIGWSWKDFVSEEKPYRDSPYERKTGYYTAQNEEKASGAALMQCQRIAGKVINGLPEQAQVGIYISEKNRTVFEPGKADYRWNGLFYSFLLLTRLQAPFEFALQGLERYKFIIVPSNYCMTALDLECLSAYVKQGGTLLYSPGSCLKGFGGEELFGNELADYCLPTEEPWFFVYLDREYSINWKVSMFDQVPIIASTSSTVLAHYKHSDEPALTVQRYGKGRAFYLNAPIELAMNQPYLLESDPYYELYASMLVEAGVIQHALFSCKDIEIHTRYYGEITYYVLINHADSFRQGKFNIPSVGLTCELKFERKAVKVLRKHGEILAEEVLE